MIANLDEFCGKVDTDEGKPKNIRAWLKQKSKIIEMNKRNQK